MKKPAFVIEIDVDGVLSDMDGSYASHVEHLIPGFNEEEHIEEWGIPKVRESCPEAHDIISALYKNPEFIRTLPRYEGVEEALADIHALATEHGGGITIHTHIHTPECAIERRRWIRALARDANVSVKTDISVGHRKKTKRNSYIVIEDNVQNLRKSSAPHKILIRRGHNRLYGEKDLGTSRTAQVAKNLKEAARMVSSILGESCEEEPFQRTACL